MDMLEIGNQKALLETGNQMTKSIYVDFHPPVSGLRQALQEKVQLSLE